MSANNEAAKCCVLEFKDWLLDNRSQLNDILRKYRAVKYYLITLSLGLLIFIGNSIITGNKSSAWMALPIVAIMIVLGYSSKIASHVSGAKRLASLPAVASELHEPWFKDVSLLIGRNCPLLDDPYIAKAVQHSNRSRFEFFTFMTSLVLVADSLASTTKEDSSPIHCQ